MPVRDAAFVLRRQGITSVRRGTRLPQVTGGSSRRRQADPRRAGREAPAPGPGPGGHRSRRAGRLSPAVSAGGSTKAFPPCMIVSFQRKPPKANPRTWTPKEATLRHHRVPPDNAPSKGVS